LREVAVLQGSPLLGALFALDRVTPKAATTLALLAAGNFCLVAHVFVLNDWSGVHTDLKDPNREDAVFVSRGVTRSGMGFLGLALLALGLTLFGAIGFPTMVTATAIAGLSALYSWPGKPMKGVPVLSSALHFVGGLLHFLLGYSAFTRIDGRGVEIACFFALLFVAGHLTHETRDSEADAANGIRTNAAAFGKQRSFIAALIVFGLADGLMSALSVLGRVPSLLVLVGAIYPLHLYWAVKVRRRKLSFESVRWLQRRYRWLYATVGLVMMVVLLVR
jgi:4-hydroxybenzoate polyprenyltransferase